MLLFLVFILFINLVVFYKVFNKNFMAPSFLFTVGLIFSSLSALCVQDIWNFHFEIETVFIIYISDICFFCGELFLFPYFSNHSCKDYKIQKNDDVIVIKKSDKFYFFYAFISFILCTVYIKGLIIMAQEAGWKGEFIFLMYYIRCATQYSDDISMSRIASWSFNFLEAYAFYAAFYIVFFKSSKKVKLCLVLSIIAYLAACILSSGRLPIIIFFFCCVVFWCIKQYQFSGITLKTNRYIIKKIMPAVVIFSMLFLVIGFARRNHENDQNKGRSTFETVSLYAGSGIIGLNQYIVQQGHRSLYVGQTTLNGFHVLLNKFGGNFPTQKNTLEFINITPKIKTNIYSAFGRLVPDYGIAGCFIIIFFMGALYALFYYMVCNSHHYGMLLYGASVYPLLLSGIEEEFLVRFLSIDYIVKVVFLYLVYTLFRITIEKKYLKVCTK